MLNYVVKISLMSAEYFEYYTIIGPVSYRRISLCYFCFGDKWYVVYKYI